MLHSRGLSQRQKSSSGHWLAMICLWPSSGLICLGIWIEAVDRDEFPPRPSLAAALDKPEPDLSFHLAGDIAVKHAVCLPSIAHKSDLAAFGGFRLRG